MVSLILRRNSRTCWKLPFSGQELEAIVSAMLRMTGNAGYQVELLLVDDNGIALLHEEQMGLSGPTNILSFPAGDGPLRENGQPLLGSMALSTDTLLRESFLYGQNTSDHAIFLIAHGMAHLLGYDHGPAMEAVCRQLEKAAVDVL